MNEQRGFIMGVVLISILALSLAGATAVLLSTSEIDMTGALRQRRQLEACAQSGVDIAASNLPFPANAPATWAIDLKRAAADQQYVATPNHVTASPYPGADPFVNTRAALGPDAADKIVSAFNVGAGIGNRLLVPVQAGVTPPSSYAQQNIQVFRLVSTCTQKSTGGKLEAEGVYVYNPQ